MSSPGVFGMTLEEMQELKLTDEEKHTYRYYTKGAYLGIKYIKSLSDATLKRAIKGKKTHETIRLNVGKDTNPSWVTGVVAEELYTRHLIDEQELDWITR